jgi:hypothetical protein
MTNPILTGPTDDEKVVESLDSRLTVASEEEGQIVPKGDDEPRHDVFGNEEGAGIKYKTNGWLWVSLLSLLSKATLTAC